MLGDTDDNLKSGVQERLQELNKLNVFKSLKEKNLVFRMCEKCDAMQSYSGSCSSIPTVPLSGRGKG